MCACTRAHLHVCIWGSQRTLRVSSFLPRFSAWAASPLPTYAISLGPYFSSEGPRLHVPQVFGHWGSDKESAARDCCILSLLSLCSLDENFPDDAICKLYVQVCLHACYLDTLFHLGWGWATKTLHVFAQHCFCYERIKPMMKIAPEIALRKITFLDMRLSVYYWPFFLTVEQRHTFTSISHGTLIRTHGVSILCLTIYI